VAANIRNGNLQNTISKRCCSSGRTEHISNGGPVVGHSLQTQKPTFTKAKLNIGTQNLHCHVPSLSTDMHYEKLNTKV